MALFRVGPVTSDDEPEKSTTWNQLNFDSLQNQERVVILTGPNLVQIEW